MYLFIYLFVVYLTTLSLAQAVTRSMISGLLIMKEAMVAESGVLYQYFHEGNEKNQEPPRSGLLISMSEFKSVTSPTPNGL
jgi:hypothetical protein